MTATTPLDWDAATYGALPLPHRAWGRGVLDRLAPVDGETVLELGCGTGRDAAALLSEYPGCRVVGLDASPQMLAAAREALAPYGDRVVLREADLRRSFALEVPVEAAMSVATLHWLPDHATVFASVAAALRPGGRFVAEAGGAGQLENVHRARRLVEGVDEPADATHFADDVATRAALERAGFTDIAVRLRPDPLVLEERTLRPYLATVILGAVLRELPAEDREAYVDAVAGAMDAPVIDYVRLEFEARRG
ncbi:Methyltransferase domain-containing protein [Raineyella antarctica]|uniref:Methyltransferase domain-containing protein n=1 Tax=Raineyella antarctica TaxID=1577474 RepID=A0A1G6I4A3_9ACTN|nr:class I SAM-dependent methyltransferase [Raineyella antarctica]SDC01238.1 Methyltransferase domain-containing protein [Raineyella antarctica]